MFWPRPKFQLQDPNLRDPNLPAPFVLERRFEDVRRGGTFTPSAVVWITPALGQSGLLREMPPDDLRLLLAVLSGVSGNGSFVATPELLSPILGLSPAATRARLEGLGAAEWNGGALLKNHTEANGLRFFYPASHLLEERHSVISPAPADGASLEVPESAPSSAASQLPLAGRDQVIAHSRASYGRPRAEVEAEINHFLSPAWNEPQPLVEGAQETKEPEPPATPEAREWLRLKRLLVGLGVPLYKVETLLQEHPAEEIARQIEWLSHRHARNPAAYIVAAITGDYAPPPGLSPPPRVSWLRPVEQPLEQQPEAQLSVNESERAALDAAAPHQDENTSKGTHTEEIQVQGLEALSGGEDRQGDV